jgi:uncharacterized protein
MAETNLSVLLKNMQPQLNAGDYVFCTPPPALVIEQQHVLFFFKEAEGVTVVLPPETASRYGLSFTIVFAWITLTVHSSLEAVGLTAAFSTALAKAGISCNVVAAFYHDHIFVPKADADKAMEVLRELAGNPDSYREIMRE